MSFAFPTLYSLTFRAKPGHEERDSVGAALKLKPDFQHHRLWFATQVTDGVISIGSTPQAASMSTTEKLRSLGPFKPTLILHGGAGAITRSSLPPELWALYHASLLTYLIKTRDLLESGSSALDAACHAVTLFEDNRLFNCGRGSVFTEKGTIEMEASVMIASVNPSEHPAGSIKRTAAVSLVKNTRHPILLAKEVLLSADQGHGLAGTSTMHRHLSGIDVERWGWKNRGLAREPDSWFWTRKRWQEHRKGLRKSEHYSFDDLLKSVDPLSISSPAYDDDFPGIETMPSQGTVGAVCMDSWGNLAVATSTGGLTNKKAGRIGDTPTVGAGFWAESWQENNINTNQPRTPLGYLRRSLPAIDDTWTQINTIIGTCLGTHDHGADYLVEDELLPLVRHQVAISGTSLTPSPSRHYSMAFRPPTRVRSRAIAISGTGNGDSFLSTDACRTASAICRLGAPSFIPLTDSIRAIAGPGGLLQRSARDRWEKTGEGQGGMIGIEVVDELTSDSTGSDAKSHGASSKKIGRAAFDFNCGGLFRAYLDLDERTGVETPKVMVFREQY
jgi:L-asparaginase